MSVTPRSSSRYALPAPVSALLALFVVLAASTAMASTALAGTGYVVNSGTGMVTPFNTDTLATGTPIKVGTSPNQAAATPNGKTVYVTNTGSNSVTPIDVATGTAGTPIPVSAPPNAIAITPDGKTAYVVSEGTSPSFTGSATPIDLTSNTAGAPITTAKGSTALAIIPDGSKVYVTNAAAKSVSVISTATNKVTATVNVGKEPRGIAITPDGKTAWVAIYGENIATPITVATNATGPSVATEVRPYGVAASPDGKKVFVANFNSNSVTRIDVAAPNTAATKSTQLGTQVQWVTFSEDGSTAFFSSPSGGVKTYTESTDTGGFFSNPRQTSWVAIAPEVLPAGTASAPGALAASAGDKQVSLSWTVPASDGGAAIDHYVIVPRIGNVDQTPIATPDASTNFTVTGLTNGQTYSFRVAAVNGNGRGRFSLRQTLRIPTVPTAPLKLSVEPGDGFAHLAWNTPADSGGPAIDHYEIKVTHNGAEAPSISTPDTATSFTVTGLTNGDNYSFTVAGVNSKGAGAAAGPVEVHLASAPTAPLNLKATTADSQVELSWSPPIDNGSLPILGYAITRTAGATESTEYVPAATHKLLGSLVNGQTYAFAVAAVTASFKGPSSDPLTVALPAPPVAAAAPLSPPLTALLTGSRLIEGSFVATLTPVDTVTGAVGAPLAIGPGGANGIAVTASGRTAWVSVSSATGTVTPIDVATEKKGTSIPVGSEPTAVAITPDESLVLVVNTGSNTVTPINTATMKAGTAIAVGTRPEAISITPDGKTALVANNNSNTVTPIDLTTLSAGPTIPVVGRPRGLAISPDGTKAYVSSEETTGRVTPIDLATMEAGAPIRVGRNLAGIAFAPNGATAYAVTHAANDSTEFLEAIDVATNTSTGLSIALNLGSEGGNLESVAISPDGTHAYVSDNGGGVTPVNLTNGRREGRIGTGSSSGTSVALSPLNVLGMSTGPAIWPLSTMLAGDAADPSQAPTEVKVGEYEVEPSELTVSAVSSSNEAVAPLAGISVSGSGATRQVTVTPGAAGTTTITLKVTGPDSQTATASFEYAATAAPATSATTRWHTGAADASTVQDVGGGYMILGDDENNTLRMYRRDSSGEPVKTWTFDGPLGINEEVDIEASTRVGDTIYWTGSHGNSKTGKNRPTRQIFFATHVSGSGANTELSFVGYYHDLKNDLIAWDQENENRLHLPEASGGVPKRVGGFNIEGLVMAPDSTTTAYVGFRAPLEPAEEGGKAPVVPVTNFDELIIPNGVDTDEEGNRTVQAHFGEPILWDLGGLSIREMKKNADDEYLIIAGYWNSGGQYALYKWDGVPADQPVRLLTKLPETDVFGEDPGAWEGIVSVPDPIVSGDDVQLIMDNGSTDFFGTGQEAKTLPVGLQKSRSDHFTLVVPTPPHNTAPPTLGGSSAVGSELTCSPGEWSANPEPTFTYGWQRDGNPIEGADSSTYSAKVPDGAHSIRCVVTATNSAGSETAASDAVAVQAAPVYCLGASITGQGSVIQATAEDGWSAAFTGKLCPGGPTVSYEATSSAAALHEWGADGAGPLNPGLAFIGTEEAPTAAQIADVKSATTGAQTAVIPVAQTSIAILADPPAGCTVEAITNGDLAAVMEGRLANWSKLEIAEGSCNAPITRVVRKDASGTTTQLQNYLFALYKKGLFCTTGSTEGKRSWAELAAGSWPESCAGKTLSALIRPAADGGAAEVEQIGATPGSIGYAALPDAEAGAEGTTAILDLQNNGQKKGGEAQFTAPAAGKAANCGAITYQVPKLGTALDVDWSGVFAAKPAIGGDSYPLCMLSYVLALHGYEAAGFSAGEATTVAGYLGSEVLTVAGQAAIASHHFSPLPGSTEARFDVLGAARKAAAKISR